MIFKFMKSEILHLWGWTLERTLTKGTAKNGDLAYASLNCVPNVRHSEFIKYF